MDITTVSLGTETRDELADYRDSQDCDNYDEAVQELLGQASPDNS
jgi:hypothetical protein